MRPERFDSLDQIISHTKCSVRRKFEPSGGSALETHAERLESPSGENSDSRTLLQVSSPVLAHKNIVLAGSLNQGGCQ